MDARRCPSCGLDLVAGEAPTRLLVNGHDVGLVRQDRAVRLVVAVGRTRVADHRLERATIGIGRDGMQDVVLDNSSVSRRHCQLRLDSRGGRFMLEDLGSDNGTLLNGRLMRTLAELTSGDEIGVGKFTVLFDPSDEQLGRFEARPEPAGGSTQEEAATTHLDPAELGKVRRELALDRGAHLRRIGEAGARYPLDQPSTVLGRSPEADIRLEGWLVAPRHAVIDHTGERRYVIRPLGWLRRVWVNRRPVRVERILASHDRITIGRNVFQFFPPV